MATFYRESCENSKCAALELPYHLRESHDKKGLLSYLRSDFRALQIPRHTRAEYAQSLRCKRTAPPNLPQLQNNLNMCKQCGMKTNLSRSAGQNKDKCVICGEWCPNTIFKDVAPRLCSQHMKMPFGPDVKQCGFCGSRILGHNGPAIQPNFCGMCATWRMSNMLCAHVGE